MEFEQQLLEFNPAGMKQVTTKTVLCMRTDPLEMEFAEEKSGTVLIRLYFVDEDCQTENQRMTKTISRDGIIEIKLYGCGAKLPYETEEPFHLIDYVRDYELHSVYLMLVIVDSALLVNNPALDKTLMLTVTLFDEELQALNSPELNPR